MGWDGPLVVGGMVLPGLMMPEAKQNKKACMAMGLIFFLVLF